MTWHYQEMGDQVHVRVTMAVWSPKSQSYVQERCGVLVLSKGAFYDVRKSVTHGVIFKEVEA